MNSVLRTMVEHAVLIYCKVLTWPLAGRAGEDHKRKKPMWGQYPFKVCVSSNAGYLRTRSKPRPLVKWKLAVTRAFSQLYTLLTYLLTPQYSIFFEKLLVTQLVKQQPSFFMESVYNG